VPLAQLVHKVLKALEGLERLAQRVLPEQLVHKDRKARLEQPALLE
jgi:hypothetical protein